MFRIQFEYILYRRYDSIVCAGMLNKPNDNIIRSLAFDSLTLRRDLCYNLSVESVDVHGDVETLRFR